VLARTYDLRHSELLLQRKGGVIIFAHVFGRAAAPHVLNSEYLERIQRRQQVSVRLPVSGPLAYDLAPKIDPRSRVQSPSQISGDERVEIMHSRPFGPDERNPIRRTDHLAEVIDLIGNTCACTRQGSQIVDDTVVGPDDSVRNEGKAAIRGRVGPTHDLSRIVNVGRIAAIVSGA
jgi:hypothetical protein